LLKIGGANAGGLAKRVSPAGEASRQRRSRIVTKCWNLARISRFVLNAPLSSAICH
jgi:hypothetical protein